MIRVQVKAGENAIAGDRVRAKLRSGSDATPEQRIALLERLVDKLDDRLEETREKADRTAKQLRDELSQERTKREKVEAEIRQDIAEGAVGDIRVEIAGFLWLVVGLVLSVWSVELAGLLA